MSVKPIFFALDGKSLNEFEFELKLSAPASEIYIALSVWAANSSIAESGLNHL